MSDLKRPLPNPSPTGYIITSPRLVLRTPRAEDAEPFMRFLSDPENFGYEAGLTIDVFQPRVEKIAARTAAGENAFMIILLRETGDIGLAREAICALTDFGFDTLGCEYMHMDTLEDNEGFRALMRDMGLTEKKGDGVEVDDAVFKFAWKSLNYDWDKATWERVKEDLTERALLPKDPDVPSSTLIS